MARQATRQRGRAPVRPVWAQPVRARGPLRIKSRGAGIKPPLGRRSKARVVMRCNGWFALATALLALVLPGVASARGGEAPGAPGASANWTTGNKQGLGTSVGTGSKVWYTLSDGALSEVYFPHGDTANVRALELAVTDGTSFVDRESDDTDHVARLADPRLLTYEQVNTAKSGRYRITKTYVTDPERETVLMRVRF